MFDRGMSNRDDGRQSAGAVGRGSRQGQSAGAVGRAVGSHLSLGVQVGSATLTLSSLQRSGMFIALR